jgi:integrase
VGDSVTASVTVVESFPMGKRGLGHVYQRGKIWWIKWYVDGSPQFESSGSDKKTDAVKLLKEKYSQGKRPKHIMVKDLVEGALKYYEEEKPKSYKDFALPVSKALLAGLKGFRADEVTTERLKAYRARRKAAGKAPATINREMAFLRLAFNRGLLTTPPLVQHVPHFPMVKENNVRQGFVEPAQYETILAALPTEVKPVLIIGYHIGARASELLALRWKDVDLKERTAVLRDTKNGTDRTVPLYGSMIECLESAPRDGAHVFQRSGKPIKDFRVAWKNATEAAGLPGLLFHDLRRSAVRNMRRAGIPETVAMKITGHKTRAIFDRYDIVDRADLHDAGAKLENFLKARKDKK